MQRNKESSRQKGKQNQSRNIQGTCPQIFGWHLLCANHWDKDAEKSRNVPALREHAAQRARALHGIYIGPSGKPLRRQH